MNQNQLNQVLYCKESKKVHVYFLQIGTAKDEPKSAETFLPNSVPPEMY